MYTQQGKIKLTNTLESRLELLSGQVSYYYEDSILQTYYSNY